MNTFLIIPNINYTSIHLEGQSEINNYQKEKLYEILNIMTTNRNQAQLNDSVDDTYTNIHHRNFKHFSNDYTGYLYILKTFDVISCDEDFQIGLKSLGYCINWRNLTFIDALPITFIATKKGNDIYKQEEELSSNNININMEILIDSQNLFKQYNSNLEYWLSMLEIDFPKSLKFATSLFYKRLNNPDIKKKYVKNPDITKKGYYEENYKNRYNQLSIELLNCNLIQHKLFDIVRDNNIFRVHTTLSKLNKKYRPFLSLNGKKLVSIDLASSQPFMLIALLNSSFWSWNTSDLNLQTLGFTKDEIDPQKINKILSLLKKKSDEDDVKIYTSLVCEGEIYQFMHEAINNTKTKITEVEKKDLKPTFYTIFYNTNYAPKSNELNIFKEKFPTIFKLISLIKRNIKTDPEKKPHKILSKILQRLESFLFIDIISNRIIQEYPDIPVLTLHDSIFTTIGNESIVSNIVKEEISKFIGFTPSLNIEY